MNSILKKMFFRGQSPVLLLGAPAEFQKTAKAFGVPVQREVKARYGFALGFAKSLAEAESAAKKMRPALDEGAVVWIAYPKGTSKKYPKVDVNRDKMYARLSKLGFEGVAMVAIDDDWAAMRFKQKA